MMNAIRFFILICLIPFTFSCSTHPHRDLHLIIISMDGLSPAYYLEAGEHGVKLPTLKALMARGVYSDGMESVYPMLTYPSHASIATGALPKDHGIYANTYYFDGEKQPVVSGKHYQRDPIWRSFKKNGLTTGCIFWPVTVDEPIDWLAPEVWWDQDKGNDAVRLQKQAAVSTPGIIDSLRESIGPPLEKYFESDTVKTEAAIYILKKYQPNLLLLHYSHFDYFQHVYGKLSPEAIAMAEMQDTQIARILASTKEIGIFEKTIFMIVSDHGHANIQWQINPGVLLAQAGLISAAGEKLSWRAMMVPSGGSCSIILRDDSDFAAKDKVLALAKELAANDGIEHVFYRQQIDSLGGDPHAVVMFEAKPGYAFGGKISGDIITTATSKSTHGYMPSKPDMLAGFIAAGPGIAISGDIGRIRSVDLFATIAAFFALQVESRDAEIVHKMIAIP